MNESAIISRFSVAIAIGGNLGNSLQIVENSIQTLDNHSQIKVTKHSSWYQTAPVGPPQPDYINGCALLSTSLTPQELLKVLLETEQKYQRVRGERWGARTLDLDLLLYDDLILNLPDLHIPHPRMRERAFVLIPLAEIAPDWVDPVTGEAIARLNQKVIALLGENIAHSGVTKLLVN